MKQAIYYKKIAFVLLALLPFLMPVMPAYADFMDHDRQDERYLREILEEMGERYQVFFNYESDLIHNIKVHFEFKQGEKLQTAVQRLLDQTGLKYEHIHQKYIIIYQDSKKGQRSVRKIQKKIRQIDELERKGRLSISRASKNPLQDAMNIATGAQKLLVEKKIQGIVSDMEGTPLIGASVRVKGTRTGAITDENGRFNITIPDGDQILIFSYIGYVSQEVLITNQVNLEIKLELNESSLDEVVVVGYGTVRKSDLTGAVSKVDVKRLENAPASRVDQLLQGRAPGVLVTATNGAPGARASIRIRGGNSINADNEPLYVIDGVIVGTGFNMNNLNVNDIESLEVLKDATAISIYGTRGANGVILITTKTGTSAASGKPEVAFNIYSGVQSLARKIEYLDGPQRAAYGSELADFSGEADPFTNPDEIGNTDWQDLVTQNGQITNADLSFSGRNENINYYVSANYFDQQGIIRETGLKRYTLRTNLDLKVTDRLKFGLRLNGSFRNSANNLVTLWGMREVLTAFPVYDSEGNFWNENTVTGGVLRNPEADLQLRSDFTLGTNLLTSAYLEFEVLKGLVWKSSFSPRLNWSKQNIFDSGQLPTRAAAQQGGRARIVNNFGYDILQENTLTYTTSFAKKHRLNIVGGFTWQLDKNESFFAETAGLSVDALSFDNIGLGNPLTYEIGSGFSGASQIVSWLGRANYTFDNRFLLTLAGRVDGASVYSGSNNAYAFFPSAAFAWRLIEEPFIQDLRIFDNLKLRTSYGSAGKESIDPYRTLAVLNSNTVIFNDQQAIGIITGRPENSELKWETTDQFDIGLEMGFFKGRLNMEFDYYYKKTRDLLLSRLIPRATGFNTKLENVGSVQNQGLEFMLNSININSENFRWETTVTLAGNRSKVLDLGGVDEIVIYNLEQGGPGAKLIVGQPIGVFTGVQYLGTYKSEEEISADGNLGTRQVLGGPRFNDTNGDGTLNNDDHEIIGNPEPLFYGGISNVFSYKNLSLEIYLQGTYGNDIYNEYSQRGFFGRSTANMYAELVDRWTPSNPNSDIPRAGSMVSISDIRSNTQLIEDGSHLRVKNIRISYTFPFNSAAINSLTVYANGANLFLASDFRGYDPEVNRLGTNSTVRGIARAEYPNAKTITIGLNANF